MFWWKSRPGELSYNSSISNNLAEMINFPIQIPAWDSHILTLELFLTLVFVLPLVFETLYFQLTFIQTRRGRGCVILPIAELLIILMLIQMVFMII